MQVKKLDCWEDFETEVYIFTDLEKKREETIFNIFRLLFSEDMLKSLGN